MTAAGKYFNLEINMEGQNLVLAGITEIEKDYNKCNNQDEFICFLRFCADRLNKDEPVQAIWNAWKAQAH